MKRGQFVFLLVTCAISFGLVGSCRALVKERVTLERAGATRGGAGAFLLAKAVVVFILVARRTLLLTAGLLAFVHLNVTPVGYFQFGPVMAACAFAAAGVGLPASAFAVSVEQASLSLFPLLMPQLLLAGALVPIADVPAVGGWLSAALAARWAVAGNASQTVPPSSEREKNNRLFNQYETFVDLPQLRACGILVAFGLVTLVACALRLRR